MSLSGDAYRQVIASYRPAGISTQAFVAARLLIAELDSLEAAISGERGSVLSLGCGHGALERYLSLTNPELGFTGLELDSERVETARATGDRFPRVRVIRQDVTELSAKPHDLAIAIDVFHHLDPELHVSTFEALASHIRPGGVCLVKDIARTPRWQYGWNRLHDRIVAGETRLSCRQPGDMASLADRAGLQVEGSRRVGRYSPYPHYLLRLRTRSDAR